MEKELVSKEILTLTEAAKSRVRHIMRLRDEEPPAIGVRIGVRNAGCSGMTYSMDYATEISAHDEVIEAGDVKVMIDPAAVMFARFRIVTHHMISRRPSPPRRVRNPCRSRRGSSGRR